MKKSLYLSLPLACCLAFGSVATAASMGATEKSLDVIINDNVLPSGMGGGWTRQDNEHNRYITLQQVVEQSLKRAGYDGKIHFMQFGANLPKNPNQLFITVERWEEAPYSRGRFIAVDFTMSAKLRLNGEETDLGRFSGRDSHIITGSGDALEDFGPAARRAVEQAVDFYQDSVAAERAES